MNEKQKTLLSILQKSPAPMTGRQIAEIMGITSRTVISYVKAVNSESSEPLIISSAEGYSLRTAIQPSLQESNNIPQNRLERAYFMVHLLLIKYPEGMNAFDMADELMISYSLLKKEVSDFNSRFQSLSVAIVSRNNLLTIEGSERDKRKLITTIIRRNQGDSILSTEQLCSFFGDSMIDNICNILNRHIAASQIIINDFSKLNLIFHMAISVSRVLNGNLLQNQEEHLDAPRSDLEKTAENIIRETEDTFHVCLDNSDYVQLLALIESHAHADSHQEHMNPSYADRNQLLILRNTMEKVRDRYYLDFTSDSFLIPFSLHVQNLLIRLKKTIHIDNPTKETFRNNSPFLYDIAVFIIQNVLAENHMDCTVDEDELTFLVMHLALEIQRQKQNDDVVRVLLYFPKYLGMEKELVSKIQIHFDEQILISGQISAIEEIPSYQYDILISTVNIPITAAGHSVLISPLLNQADWSILNDSITKIHQEKMMKNFRTVFPLFFDEKNFIFTSDKAIDKYSAIHIICTKLKQNSYITDGFENAVRERENAISTGYLNFAVPHAVNIGVKNETVGMLIAPEGIHWKDRTVYVVLLMAIQPDNLLDFQRMYNALLILLLETDIVNKLKKTESFEQFRQALLNEALLTR